ncbi:MAG: hypothetical protein TREMPRED_005399 [Tremellales sp. Tagirdzhanova-0007]|nr:MAG: hypothetical protein TREMPRED_005399 [Tremellales sp. Tagirdzhanova-0007]
MSAPHLPTPRRLIMGHKADGTPVVHDETVPTTRSGTFAVAQAFMQDGFDPDPIEAVSGKDKPVQGMVNPKGTVVRWVDIPPNTDTPMHYTNTIDYIVCTHGTIEILLHDGSKYKIQPGDFAVQLANVHQLNNKGDDWARFVGVILPSKPGMVDGKNHTDGPLKALQF